MTQENFNSIQAGWSAHGRDGDKVGEIEEVGRDYLLVTKGLIFTTDLYIPTDAVAEVDTTERRVYLAVDKGAVEDQGWNEPPRESASVEGLGYTGRESETSGATAGAAGRQSELGQGEDVRMPLREEQLRAERTTETAGEVRVGKRVREEQREMDVPVTHDEVQVKRVATDRPAAADEGAFSDGDTIRVPVTEERVNVSKEPRVVEEVEISRRPVTRTEHVGGTVRREEAEVDESGNVLAGSGAAMGATRSDVGDETTSGMRRAEDDLDEERKA